MVSEAVSPLQVLPLKKLQTMPTPSVHSTGVDRRGNWAVALSSVPSSHSRHVACGRITAAAATVTAGTATTVLVAAAVTAERPSQRRI
jgi:hypothetical protein